MSGANYGKYAAQAAIAQIKENGRICATRAETIWSAIDNGNLDDADTAYWCRLIAKGVVKDVIQKREEGRDDRALQALKLAGRRHTTLTEQAFAWSWLQLHAQDAPTDKIERDKRLLAAMQAAGLYSGVSVKDAMKRLKRLLQQD
ncbi:MAG: hypothetical protein RLZZ61_1654 [Pseudomonadota bacterium]|jgi:hypothetical protein